MFHLFITCVIVYVLKEYISAKREQKKLEKRVDEIINPTPESLARAMQKQRGV